MVEVNLPRLVWFRDREYLITAQEIRTNGQIKYLGGYTCLDVGAAGFTPVIRSSGEEVHFDCPWTAKDVALLFLRLQRSGRGTRRSPGRAAARTPATRRSGMLPLTRLTEGDQRRAA
jgi:hypothetical protein